MRFKPLSYWKKKFQQYLYQNLRYISLSRFSISKIKKIEIYPSHSKLTILLICLANILKKVIVRYKYSLNQKFDGFLYFNDVSFSALIG